MAKESAIVQRFEAGADATEKREFARALVAALEEVGVLPGHEFIVTTGEHLDSLEAEIRQGEAGQSRGGGEGRRRGHRGDPGDRGRPQAGDLGS